MTNLFQVFISGPLTEIVTTITLHHSAQ